MPLKSCKDQSHILHLCIISCLKELISEFLVTLYHISLVLPNSEADEGSCSFKEREFCILILKSSVKID